MFSSQFRDDSALICHPVPRRYAPEARPARGHKVPHIVGVRAAALFPSFL